MVGSDEVSGAAVDSPVSDATCGGSEGAADTAVVRMAGRNRAGLSPKVSVVSSSTTDTARLADAAPISAARTRGLRCQGRRAARTASAHWP